MIGENKTRKQRIKKVSKWFNKKSVTPLHILTIYTIFSIILIIFIFLEFLNPWSLLSLFYGIILLWFLIYNNKIAAELSLSYPDDTSFKPIDVKSNLDEMLIQLNLLIDVNELSFLNYIQLRERRLLIKLLKPLIYILFLLTFFLFLLDPNLSPNSVYSEFRSLLINILSLIFILNLNLKRIKSASSLFKNWINLVKKQLVSITNLSATKQNCADVSIDIDNLNRRIENYTSYFNPVNQIMNIGENVGYFLTILSIILPPILNINILIQFFPYYCPILLLFIIYLGFYSYYSIVDRVKFHRDYIIKLWKSELDKLLKNINIGYKVKLTESKEKFTG